MANTVAAVNDFSGGMIGDDRAHTTNTFSVLKNFDVFSRKQRITPFNDTTNADGASTTNEITDFINYTGGVGSLFGLGNDGTHVQVLVKDSNTSGTHWSTFASSTGSAGLPVAGVFFQYGNLAYGTTGGGVMWKCDLSGGGFTNTDTTLSSAVTCNAITHSKDGIAYIGHGSVLAKNVAGSWADNILPSIPSKYTIACLAEFNDQLAIGCNGTDGHAVVYLWDKQTSLTGTANSCLDWGFGTIKTLQQVEEYLVGVSLVGASGLYPKMVFRKFLSGAGGVVFNELFASSTVGLQVVPTSQKISNRMYFAGGITIDGVLHNGIFGIARPPNKTEFVVWIDRLPNNDTAIAASSLQGFIYVNDYVFISYLDGTYQMRFTNSNGTAYSATSLCETTWNPNMAIKDRTKNKQLKVVAISTVPIGINGGQIVVDYKVTGDVANDAPVWITIGTVTTVGSVTSEFANDANGSKFTAGREYKFRIKCGAGSGISYVEPTELKYSYEVLDSLI